MCGIAGIWHYNGKAVSEKKLKQFTDSMAHRGPDASGYEFFASGTLGLGHRRLSILDLSDAGKQPMSYADGRYWITYNGEVYNFLELRKELQKQGFSFHTETDTEVILAAYQYWGKSCLDHFNGMWAFAIWDEQEQSLFMARDRFGIKPLYYSHIPDKQFAFASETRAFKYLEEFNREFDETLLAIEIEKAYSLEGLGYTIFKDIYQLLPGHYMLMKASGNISQKRWWHIEEHNKQNVPGTLREQAEEFYKLFRDACRIRLISDVPVATALSGGVDSTAIYSTVADILKQGQGERINKNSQLAVSAIFPGLESDEKHYVDQAIAYTGGPVKWVETDYANLQQQIEHDTELFDSLSEAPITAISAIYKGMKEAGITVSLDGHGVDEMLYGYLDMVYALYNDAGIKGPVRRIRQFGETLRELYHPDHSAETRQRFDTEIQALELKAREPLQSLKRQIKTKFPAKEGSYTPVKLPALSDNPYDFSQKPIPERMVYYEFFQHTLPSLLRNFDRASMMNSVEIRMPFMDWRLVSYIFSLPIESKIGNGFTKRILREAMKGKMSENIRSRTHKIGVGSPVEHWFSRYLGNWIKNKKNSAINDRCVKSRNNDLWKKINIEIMYKQ